MNQMIFMVSQEIELDLECKFFIQYLLSIVYKMYLHI